MANLQFAGWPDVPYLQRLHHVPCPTVSENMEETRDQTNIARYVFEYLCPPAATVLDVSPIRQHEEYKCVWKVQYCQNKNVEITRKEMLRQIQIAHPQNTKIILGIPNGYPPAVDIHYSMLGCACTRTPLGCSSIMVNNIDASKREDVLINDYELSREFVNMNIEENL